MPYLILYEFLWEGKEGLYMNNKLANTQNNKIEDGHFKKKNIKHSPKDESSRAALDEKMKITGEF